MLSTSHRFYTAAILCILFVAIGLPAALSSPVEAAVSDTPPAPETRSAKQAPRLPPAPAKLPDDIERLCPTYPGALLLQVEKGEQQTRAMFKSAAPPVEISEHYKKELTHRGWVVFKEMSEGNSVRLILNKGSEQIGFSAIQHPSKVVTYFISLRNI